MEEYYEKASLRAPGLSHAPVAPPWVKYRDDIKAVVIEEGVTHIGAQCFQFCTKLKSVTIPSSVESIGAAAFYRCEKLSAVYYGGTASDWNKIEIERYNKRLTSAELVIADTETSAPAPSEKPVGGKLK